MKDKTIIYLYINQVRRNIYNPSSAKLFLAALQNDLEEYVTQFPESTFDNLVEQFGTPETVAQDFLDSVQTIPLRKKVLQKKRRTITWIILLVILLFLLAFCIALSSQQQVMFDDVTVETSTSFAK